MGDNMSSVTEFILLGFPVDTRTQMLLFGPSPCSMSSPCWRTGSSWGSPHWTPDCTPPCTSSSHTWPSLTWPTPAAWCPRCWSTSWVQPSPSPLLAASHRPFSFWVLLTLSVCCWWWCPMIGMWPSATRSDIQSSWAGESVSCWWWLPGPLESFCLWFI